MAKKISGGARLAQLLKNEGVKYVIGVPGGQLFPFMNAITQDSDMQLITTRHEQNAAHVADAITRVTGVPSVCFGTVGPGAMNMFSGVATANADGSPIFVLTPNHQTFNIYPNLGSIQDSDNYKIFGTITKWNAVVHMRSRMDEIVRMAFRKALGGRTGPVHIDVPVNIMYETMEDGELIKPEYYRPMGRIRSDETLIAKAAQILASAKRPLLIAGGGVRRSKAEEPFRKLIKHFQIPATTTPNGAGVIDWSDPGFIGDSGWLGGDAVVKAMREADVILAVGCRFSGWIGLGRPPVFAEVGVQKIIQIDIEAESIGQNVPVTLGIVGDAYTALEQLDTELSKIDMTIDANWFPSLQREYQKFKEQIDRLVDINQVKLNEATVLSYVSQEIADDAFVTFDGGQIMEWAHTYIKLRSPEQKLYVPGMGHLGYGLPFAIGAKLAFPQREVFNITGDGSFGMSIQELETAVRYNLPIINVVVNDRAWGMIRLGLGKYFGHTDGATFTDLDFAMIAQGFGCYGEKVTASKDIRPALIRAKASGKPAVIDIRAAFTPHPADSFWVSVTRSGCELPNA